MEEWPAAGRFLSESQPPTTPPVIESWSSSSSNDDDTRTTNASVSTSSKKPKKRKINNRLKTKLNFDECVLTQHKNQQWVTPKVTKILRQCLDEDEAVDIKIESMLDLKEPLKSKSLVGISEVIESPLIESSSSSMGYVDMSPDQNSVQNLLKRNLHHKASSSLGMTAKPVGSLHQEPVTPEKSNLNFAKVVMSSSQETDFDDSQHKEKSPEDLGSKIDTVNTSESSTIQSSPIITLSKVPRLKKKRKRITSSPVIDIKIKSLKSFRRELNLEKDGEATLESPMNFESTLSSDQEENLQLSPVIASIGISRIQKLDKSNSRVPISTEKSPRVENEETINSYISESDFDSIIEETQLSPIIKSIGRRSKRSHLKNKDSLIVANSVAESPTLTSSSLVEQSFPDAKTGAITRSINRQDIELNQSASEPHHSSSYTPENRVNSPIIQLYSSKKKRKNHSKKVQKNLADSFQVSETSSESEVLSTTTEKSSVEQVVQGNGSADSQSDYIEGTQLCQSVFTKGKSSGKDADSDLKTSTLNDHSAINSPNLVASKEKLSLVTTGTEKEVPSVPPFKDFLVPLPKSSIDTQNPSDYDISVDLDTQNVTLPLKQISHCHPVKNSSNLFSSDSSPVNISFSTQDSMDLIVNSLVAKKRVVPDCLEAEAITIDSFSSQDTSSETRVPCPAKITSVSDLPSPKSSGYQIVSCSSQSTDQTSPVRNEEPCVDMDSAKKKKRLQKGGYAARLQTLLNRQKSASRIFQHEMLNNAEKFIDKGTRLHVREMKYEFDKVLLQCTFSAEENKEETALVLMDPKQCKKIVTNCTITIYPPWRVLTIPKNSAKVITDVFNFQVIPAGDEFQISPVPSTTDIQEFKCDCMDSAKCAFKLPRNGLEIFEVLFPNLLLLNVPSRQIMQTTACNGTISEILALSSDVSDKYIEICIQRVFHFNDIDKGEVCWSLLGQDSKGELSEVLLPPRNGATTDYGAIVAGDVYRVSVVNVMKRIHRNKSPGLWAVVDCKNASAELPSTSNVVVLSENEHNLKQLYIYVITATSSEENVQKLDSVFKWARHSWMKPTVCNLFSVTNMPSSNSYAVFSFRVKIILVTEDLMYVTDLSLSHSVQSYCAVGLRPSFCLPADLASKKCGLAFLHDVLFLNGQLFMDRYSSLEMRTDQWPVEVVQMLLAEKINFGGLVATSAVKDLVSVSGKIIAVDADTAFEWLACIECSGSVLATMPDGTNLCNVCNKTVLSRPMMSLEILVSVGEIVVKIKLQQSTIVLLLPPSQNDGEGFELSSILDKQIGPVDCLVLESVTDKDFAFVVEELPKISIQC